MHRALTLSAGDWHATLLPDQGATFARLAHAGRELLVPIPAGAAAIGPFHGAFVMAPWTNRLDRGRITVGGVEHRMTINRPGEGTALHGLFRDLPWQVESAAADRATLARDLVHPPFRCALRMEVRLSAAGLALRLLITNLATSPTPLGLGWHPFFARPAGMHLRLAARTVFGRDQRNLPVAPTPSTGIEGAALDGLDTHFAGWDGVADISYPDGATLRLAADGAWRGNVQVFAPGDAGILCVEPVSHAPDAANRAEAAAHGAMHLVPPSESLDCSLMIHWR